MASSRLGTHQQMELALDELVRLGSLLDELSIVVTGPEQVSIRPKNGAGAPVRVIAYDAVGEAQARHLVATEARGRKIVVANRISEPARRYLASRGWGWLDRRIGADIPLVEATVNVRYVGRPDSGNDRDDGSPAVRLSRPATDGPLRGRAGIAYAFALLCNPNDPPSFRSVADAVAMSPTAISNAVKHLAAAGLVGAGNRPTLPDLFWEVADVWSPLKVVAVAAAPDPHSRQFATQLDHLDQPGWVLGGDLAAAELGAPVFSAEDRPWLGVPTQVELRRAERALGSAAWSDRAAVIAAPPTALVCRWRRPPRPGGTPWPLPHPVAAALDLGRDPGRGREILSQWSPEGADAVWR